MTISTSTALTTVSLSSSSSNATTVAAGVAVACGVVRPNTVPASAHVKRNRGRVRESSAIRPSMRDIIAAHRHHQYNRPDELVTRNDSSGPSPRPPRPRRLSSPTRPPHPRGAGAGAGHSTAGAEVPPVRSAAGVRRRGGQVDCGV